MLEAILALAALGGLYYIATKDDAPYGGESADQTAHKGWQTVVNKTPLTYGQLDAYAMSDGKGGYKPVMVRFVLSHKVEGGGDVVVYAMGEVRDIKVADDGTSKEKRIWQVAFFDFDPESLKNAEMKLLTSKVKMPASPDKGALFVLVDNNIFA